MQKIHQKYRNKELCRDMKTEKEYPATHSMETSWFFVDKEDNVAIFKIDSNGPVPGERMGSDVYLEDLCFDYPIKNINGLKHLNLTDEQVISMLEDRWETKVPDDYYWSEDIIQIDKNKEHLFFEILEKSNHVNKRKEKIDFRLCCLSQNLGIYYLHLDSYDLGKGLSNPIVKYLVDNDILQRFCRLPYFSNEVNPHCPYYIYENQWDPAIPFERTEVPEYPVKLWQMPDSLKEQIIRLPVKFQDSNLIQIAHTHLCYSSLGDELMTEDGRCYVRMHHPGCGEIFVLNRAISNEEIDRLGLDKEKINLDELLAGYPLILPQKEVERLKSLDINQDYDD